MPTYNHTREDSPLTPCDICKPRTTHITAIAINNESFRRGGSCRTAQCCCGWIGPQRATIELAADDAIQHETRTRPQAPKKCRRCGKHWCGTDLKLRELYPAEFSHDGGLDGKVTNRVTYGSKKCSKKGPKR